MLLRYISILTVCLLSLPSVADGFTMPGDSVQSSGFAHELITSMSEGVAQVKQRVKKLDDVDTLYIEPNHFNYAAMLQNTNYWQHYRLRAKGSAGNYQQIDISPRSSVKVGPYFGWRWLFLGYTFDVGSIGKATRNTEFNLSIYTSKIGGDFMYIRNKADFKLGRVKGFTGIHSGAFDGQDFNGMKAYSTMANVYYVFNHRRFSYPAAYAQSTVQRLSAGSFILGLRYDHHKILFDHRQLPASLLYTPQGESVLFDAMKIGTINYYNAGISLGYAYNWVIARNLLFNVSLMPAIGYKKTKGVPWDKKVLLDDVRTFNIDFTSRAALVWNNTRCYAGASFINYVYGYNRAYFHFRNSISYLNFYFGVNFSRKK